MRGGVVRDKTIGVQLLTLLRGRILCGLKEGTPPARGCTSSLSKWPEPLEYRKKRLTLLCEIEKRYRGEALELYGIGVQLSTLLRGS